MKVNAAIGRQDSGTLQRGWVDVSARALVEMKGAESLDLLQRISTNDVAPLSQGKWVQTIFTNEKGRIVEVVTAVKSGESIFLAGQSQQEESLLRWLEKFIIMEDVRVSGVSSSYRHLLLLGDSALPGRGDGCITFEEHFGTVRLAHHLLPSGKNEVPGQADQVTPDQYQDFRIRHGIPAWPSELSDEYNPLEAGLGPMISWTKGCYVGQEVIARLDTYKKVQKHLTILDSDQRPDSLPVKLVHDGVDVGMVTSSVSAPEDGRFTSLAYLRTGAESGGTVKDSTGALNFRIRS